MNYNQISEDEINRIYTFINDSKFDLIDKYQYEENIRVCIPKWYLELLNHLNSLTVRGYFSVTNNFIFGIPVQSHFENKIVVFYDHPFKTGIFLETEIKSNNPELLK